MKEKKFALWGSIRNKGKLRFILINGLLSYGVSIFIAMALANNPLEFTFTFTIQSVLESIVTRSMGGIFFGVFMWCYNEDRYKKEMIIRKKSKY